MPQEESSSSSSSQSNSLPRQNALFHSGVSKTPNHTGWIGFLPVGDPPVVPITNRSKFEAHRQTLCAFFARAMGNSSRDH